MCCLKKGWTCRECKWEQRGTKPDGQNAFINWLNSYECIFSFTLFRYARSSLVRVDHCIPWLIHMQSSVLCEWIDIVTSIDIIHIIKINQYTFKITHWHNKWSLVCLHLQVGEQYCWTEDWITFACSEWESSGFWWQRNNRLDSNVCR